MDIWIEEDGQRKGPYTLGQIKALWNAGRITSHTLHFAMGDSAWTPLGFRAALLEEPRSPLAALGSGDAGRRRRWVYIVLAVLLGALGIHDFYAGRLKEGAILVGVSLIGSLLIVGPFVSMIAALVEAITVKMDGDGHPMQ